MFIDLNPSKSLKREQQEQELDIQHACEPDVSSVGKAHLPRWTMTCSPQTEDSGLTVVPTCWMP